MYVLSGERHNKERRFTVYKPTRIEKPETTEIDIEESSDDDEATGELAKRGLGKIPGKLILVLTYQRRRWSTPFRLTN